MKRRDFLRTAGGTATAAAALAGNAAAQEETETDSAATGTASGTGTAGTGTAGAGTGTGTGTGTGGGGGLPGSGVTKTVLVGPNGDLVFTPGTEQPLRIAPGTTVKWVWKSDNHNVIPDQTPSGVTWKGTPGGESKTYNTGYTYTHTFTTLGTYTYYCAPHKSAGMVGTIEVLKNPQAAAQQKSLHEYGVPIQAHYVGGATILGIIATIVYTFYILKYGESPNTGNTGGGEGE